MPKAHLTRAPSSLLHTAHHYVAQLLRLGACKLGHYWPTCACLLAQLSTSTTAFHLLSCPFLHLISSPLSSFCRLFHSFCTTSARLAIDSFSHYCLTSVPRSSTPRTLFHHYHIIVAQLLRLLRQLLVHVYPTCTCPSSNVTPSLAHFYCTLMLVLHLDSTIK